MVPEVSWKGFAGTVETNAPGTTATTTGDASEDKTVGRGDGPQAVLHELEREIVAAAAEITTTTHRLLDALRRFDEKRGWQAYGRKSTADWLCWRTGLSLSAAREHVRVARSLARLPSIDEALQTAQISFSKVRALTRVATSENEGRLLELASRTTAQELERVCRRFRNVALDEIEGRDALARAENRYLRYRHLDDGYVQIVVQLPPEEAAEFRAILDAAGMLARRESRAASRQEAAGDEGPAAVADTGAHEVGRDPPGADALEERTGFDRADALLSICRAFRESPTFRAGTLPRCEVFVEVPRDTLAGAGEEPGVLEDGTAVAAATARRLACDAAIVPVSRDETGKILDVGRRTRAVPAAMARALRLRDRSCRFPGCANTVALDAHHLIHWARGGPTSLDNLIRLCTYHHWCLHEGGFTASREGERLVFRDPRGQPLSHAPGLHQPLPSQGDGPAPNGEVLLPPRTDHRIDLESFVDEMIEATYGDREGKDGPRAARMPLPDGSTGQEALPRRFSRPSGRPPSDAAFLPADQATDIRAMPQDDHGSHDQNRPGGGR